MSSNLQYIIYALLCPQCGCPRYIGKSTSGLDRISMHRNPNYKSDGSVYKRNWVKSLNNKGLTFDFSVLTALNNSDQLDEAEIYWIKYFKDLNCPLTNLTGGGGGLYRYKFSEESRARMSAWQIGKKLSKEVKDKISLSLMGKPNARKGIPATRKQKEKQAIALGAKPFIDQYGNMYTSLFDAADRLNLKRSNICNVLKGRRKKTGGYAFKYI